MISLNIEKTFGFISKENVFAYEAQVKAAQEANLPQRPGVKTAKW